MLAGYHNGVEQVGVMEKEAAGLLATLDLHVLYRIISEERKALFEANRKQNQNQKNVN